jgi:hypothetical protein
MVDPQYGETLSKAYLVSQPIQRLKVKQRIYYILSSKIIHLVMEINARQRFSS